MSWTRVTKHTPCPVCGKGDWCAIGDFWVNCMRIPSDRPCKNGGYLHSINANRPRPERRESPPRPVINTRRIIAEWSAQTRREWLQSFGLRIGMTMNALEALNCCWATPHRAWAFPMSDGYGNWVGIRLRAESGKKWAVPGSHQGVFIPRDKWDKMLLVCEGPTDTGAALDLGYWAVGRPSCSGGVSDLSTFVKRRGVRRCVICADNDQVGVLGAKTLQTHLPCNSCILVLPAKDIRAFKSLGGTRELLESMISTAIWNGK